MKIVMMGSGGVGGLIGARLAHAGGAALDCVGALKALGFDGAFSVHPEYGFDESIIRRVGYADTPPPNLEAWAEADAVFLRRMWMEA